MKIVFMGTPDISVPCLQMLIDSKHEVIGVVTQPDRPKGRGKKLSMSPVKELAQKYDISVYQPLKAKEEDFVQIMKNLEPDLIVVIAFGQILNSELLNIPKFGCVNVHVSLLPKYRGAAPINWVIINGEKKTGVTTMFMDKGLDTGDIILQEEIELDDEITAGELHDKMMLKGAEVLSRTISDIEAGTVKRTKQDDSKFSYAPIMNKELGKVDFNNEAKNIHNLIRGVNPWPSAYTTYEDKTMKIWKTKVLNSKSTEEEGTILKVDKSGIVVSTKDFDLLIEEIQMPNKKKMAVSEYIKGNEIKTGIKLGS
ncbi:MAG: methionyl-tRNA formyltransferase [Clostridioides sp.]|jgi:methionyl-tRNA formyltransferase|nr:methionyl-tRNA formyltransferase [Clostridioides sp.]